MGILLGQEVRDIVCVRYAVQPRGLDKDGKPFDDRYVDQEQLEVLGDGVRLGLVPVRVPSTGGPHPNPVREADPPRR